MRPRTPTAAESIPDAPGASGIGRRVNAERLALLGWSRAILMQLAHPLVAAGVYEHSSVRSKPLAAAGRLHATVRAMLALTFGTDAERQYAIHGIRTIHRRVHGTLPQAIGPFPAGTPYSAEDPALVLWVHLTLLDSVPLAYELLVAPLTPEERDVYCEEAAWVAIALGATAANVPRTWQEAQRALHRTAAEALAVGPAARELASLVLSPRIARLLPLAGWLNELFTIGLLPPDIRAMYEFRWSEARQRRLDRTLAATRAVRLRLPDVVALWPEARA